MAIENFEGKNIQDTFQRVVQTDSTNRLADGTGSIFIPVSSSHAITASHALFAISASHEITFELSSSHAVSADTASFATNFTASNNISASGEIIGNKIFGNLIGGKTDGSGIVLGSASDIHVTASGNISASLNSKIFASSASFGGASFLRSFNVKGAGLDGRLNLQGTAGTDNPGIEFTVNDNTSRALNR